MFPVDIYFILSEYVTRHDQLNMKEGLGIRDYEIFKRIINSKISLIDIFDYVKKEHNKLSSLAKYEGTFAYEIGSLILKENLIFCSITNHNKSLTFSLRKHGHNDNCNNDCIQKFQQCAISLGLQCHHFAYAKCFFIINMLPEEIERFISQLEKILVINNVLRSIKNRKHIFLEFDK